MSSRPPSPRASCRTTGPATRLRCYAATPRPALAARAPGVDSCHPSPPLRATPGQGVNEAPKPKRFRGFIVCEPRLANIVHAAGVDIVRQSRISSTRSVDIVIPASGGNKGRAFIGKRRRSLEHPHAPKRNSCRFCAGGLFSQTMGAESGRCRIGNEIRPQGGRTKSTPAAWTISAPDGADDILAALGRQR